jgi:hypothetical protein
VVARLEEARMMAAVAKWIRMTAAATKRWRARERVATKRSRARERVADIYMLIGKNIMQSKSEEQGAGIAIKIFLVQLKLKLMGRQEFQS